jgi:CheY-like chemotaxis protein
VPTSLRILLVEDHQDEREMYALWLQSLGAMTIQVSSARDAFRAAVELQPDVVVTDVRLAGRANGLALARCLKRHSTTRPVPVIVLSASVSPRLSALAQHAGCDLLLTKPCPPDVLSDTIRGLLPAGRTNLSVQPALVT